MVIWLNGAIWRKRRLPISSIIVSKIEPVKKSSFTQSQSLQIINDSKRLAHLKTFAALELRRSFTPALPD